MICIKNDIFNVVLDTTGIHKQKMIIDILDLKFIFVNNAFY